MKFQSNFGYIRNREPEPLFFDVKTIRPRGKLAKAKKSFPARGITLFVDAPKPKIIYDTARRRTTSMINSEYKSNPRKYDNYYQMNKKALAYNNRIEVKRVDETTNALKLAEVALLARLVENIDKKEQVESKIGSSDELERLQAQQTFSTLEQENNQLKQQLQQQRDEIGKAEQRRQEIVVDAVNDRREKETQEQRDLDFAKAQAQAQSGGVDMGAIAKMVAIKAREREERIAKGLKGIERDFGVRLEVAEPPRPPPPPPPLPQPKELGDGGGLPAYLQEIETEQLVADDEELVLTEEQEEAYERKLGDLEKKAKGKGKKRTQAHQKHITSKGAFTKANNNLKKEVNLTARNKRAIPRDEKLIKDLIQKQAENEAINAVLTKDKKKKTMKRTQLIRDIDDATMRIQIAREQLKNQKEKTRELRSVLKEALSNRTKTMNDWEDDIQHRALREDN